MPQYFQRPENALKRASELLEVGKRQDALDALHDVIKSRRHRTWTKVHEQIMTKHLELCVDLRKPHLAKDGLFQYRNMCQQINVKSLENVIVAFLALAERKADEARQESQGMVEDVVEDLDQAESPETLLLKVVSGEGAQDRADRAVLSPWLRFLWESYRQCLELLRNNQQVETLYHRIAKQGFQFCEKYQRKSEFKKLCDNLRTHLNQLQKLQHQQHTPKLTNPDTLALHQETRLVQLEAAIHMELWQEAYKSSEDVHNMMQLSKRVAKPQVLANYYEKLALVFWKAGNTLFHAATLFKLFMLYREQKRSFGSDEATQLATRVLLAVLSIQFSSSCSTLSKHLDMEDVHLEHQKRLSQLLGLLAPPTRQTLLKDLQRFSVISLALPSAQALYQWLEVEFSPLKLAAEVQQQLDAIKTSGVADYAQYIDALQNITALKILKQISQIYQSMSLARLRKIIPFFSAAYRLEYLLVTAAKRVNLQVRLDHRADCILFGSGEVMGVGDDDLGGRPGDALTVPDIDAPVIQSMPNEEIRQHLQQMYTALEECTTALDMSAEARVTKDIRDKFQVYKYHLGDVHKKMLDRKKRIELYKETSERLQREQVNIYIRKLLYILPRRLKFQEEKERLEEEKAQEEAKRREEERLQKAQIVDAEQRKAEEIERKRKIFVQDRVQKMRGTDAGRKALEALEAGGDLDNVDTDMLIQTQVMQLEKERKEQQEKLRHQERKWDYFIRALHLEEIPMLQQEHEDNKLQDVETWEQRELERCANAEQDRQLLVDHSIRLRRVEQDAKDFKEMIRQTRKDDVQRRMLEFENKLTEVRAKRMEERKNARKEERRKAWLKEREEARQKAEEEKKRAEEDAKRASEDRRGNREGGPTRGPGFGGGARMGGGPGMQRDQRGGDREQPMRDPDQEPANWRRTSSAQATAAPESARPSEGGGSWRSTGPAQPKEDIKAFGQPESGAPTTGAWRPRQPYGRSSQEPSQQQRDDGRPPVMERAGDSRPPVMERAGDSRPPVMERAGDSRPPVMERAGDGRPPAMERAGDGRPPAMERGGDEEGGGSWRRPQVVPESRPPPQDEHDEGPWRRRPQPAPEDRGPPSSGAYDSRRGAPRGAYPPPPPPPAAHVPQLPPPPPDINSEEYRIWYETYVTPSLPAPPAVPPMAGRYNEPRGGGYYRDHDRRPEPRGYGREGQEDRGGGRGGPDRDDRYDRDPERRRDRDYDQRPGDRFERRGEGTPDVRRGSFGRDDYDQRPRGSFGREGARGGDDGHRDRGEDAGNWRQQQMVSPPGDSEGRPMRRPAPGDDEGGRRRFDEHGPPQGQYQRGGDRDGGGYRGGGRFGGPPQRRDDRPREGYDAPPQRSYDRRPDPSRDDRRPDGYNGRQEGYDNRPPPRGDRYEGPWRGGESGGGGPPRQDRGLERGMKMGGTDPDEEPEEDGWQRVSKKH